MKGFEEWWEDFKEPDDLLIVGIEDAYRAGWKARGEVDAEIAERDLILMGNEIADAIRNQE